MTICDQMAEANADDECRVWVRRVIDAKPDIVAFVDQRLCGEGTGEFVGYLKGSFNLSLCIRFGNGRRDALIRFPKPGHTVTAWRAEKVINEVQVLQYLNQNATIPLPCVLGWGLEEESPQKLGPFILMDVIQGKSLASVLKKATKDDPEDLILDPDFDNAKLDFIYDQLANYLLQISRFNFTRIGAISRDSDSNTWPVSGRPLTYNMNELVTVMDYPISQVPSKPFDRSHEYFKSLAEQHLVNLDTQRNLADDEEDTRKSFIACHRLKELIPKYCVNDSGSFKLFCDDMQPTNMLVDPETFRITAVLDFEFSNAMPAQFTYDPPSWLLVLGPDVWILRRKLNKFLSRYVPKMEQFLRALERQEEKMAVEQTYAQDPPLSKLMRESWETGRFWFNYAARKSLDVDAIYWSLLHQDDAGGEDLDEAQQAELSRFQHFKIEQLKGYNKDYKIRFASGN